MNKSKIVSGVIMLSMLGLGLASYAGAAIINVPAYSDVMNGTSSAFATGLFGDLIQWVGAIVALAIAGLLLLALRNAVIGGVSKVFKGKKGRGRRMGR